MAIRSGAMRYIVDFECLPENPAYGDEDNWRKKYVRVRAQRLTLSAAESGAVSGEVSSARYRFKLRYLSAPAVTPSFRLVCGGSVFDIEAVDNVGGKNRELVVDCVYRSRLSASGI